VTVPVWLSEQEHAVVAAACERLVPAVEGLGPGARRAGVADYIDATLGAFSFDPPRIWAGGPFSGRHGGAASFADFEPLTPYAELAWRTRIEGSRGIAEREPNGPVTGWQELYRTGLAALGDDFCMLTGEEQDARLEAAPEAFRTLLYQHTCEGMYAAPEYGGNRDLVAWDAIGFAGDVQPLGFTDAEVRDP
jgi:hypothetical protein